MHKILTTYFRGMKARIDSYSAWIPGFEPSKLKPVLEECLKNAGFTILNFMEHRFQPVGFTAIWLLAESHFAMHTFPEEGKTYIELASCNRQMYVNFKGEFEKVFSNFELN